MIDIFSLTPRSRLFQPLSWKVYTGAERMQYSVNDSVALHVTGGGGVAYSLFEDGLFYSLGTLRLEHNKDLSEQLIQPALGVDVGMLWHWERMTAHVKFIGGKFANDFTRGKLQYDHNFVLGRHQSVKLMMSREKFSDFFSSDINVALQIHF